MSDGISVKDPAFINEFYANAQSLVIRKIRDHITTIANDAGIKPYHSECEACSNPFDTTVIFDYSNFFDLGS